MKKRKKTKEKRKEKKKEKEGANPVISLMSALRALAVCLSASLSWILSYISFPSPRRRLCLHAGMLLLTYWLPSGPSWQIDSSWLDSTDSLECWYRSCKG